MYRRQLGRGQRNVDDDDVERREFYWKAQMPTPRWLRRPRRLLPMLHVFSFPQCVERSPRPFSPDVLRKIMILSDGREMVAGYLRLSRWGGLCG